MFRKLDAAETKKVRQWARDNYTPNTTIPGIWHPVVRAECMIMNEENPANIQENLKQRLLMQYIVP